MSLISNADEIKRNANIADIIGRRIPLRPGRDGHHLEGSCPFHQSKSGKSFHVTPDKHMWYCWGCQEGGNAVNFVMKYDNVDYREALEIVAAESRIIVRYADGGNAVSTATHPPRQDVQKALEAACGWYETELHNPRNQMAMDYIKNRGYSDGILKKYRIGYAMGGSVTHCGVPLELLKTAGIIKTSDRGITYDPLEGRIIIPIMDSTGRPAGFTGRLITDSSSRPKYLNTGTTPCFQKARTLFGWKESRDILRSVLSPKKLYIVEGQLKTIAMLESGYPTVAAGGTAFTDSQVAMVARLSDNIIIVPDPDDAGLKAAVRIASALRAVELTVQIGNLNRERDPLAKDPDDLYRQHLPIEFDMESLISFLYRHITHNKIRDVEQAKAVVKHIVPIIAAHPIPAVRHIEMRELSNLSGLPESALQGEPKSQDIATIQPEPVPMPKVSPDLPPDRMLIAVILQTGVTKDNPDWYLKFDNFIELPWSVLTALQDLHWTFRYTLTHGVSVADALAETTTPDRLPWYQYWLSCDTGDIVSIARANGLAKQIILESRNAASMQAARVGHLELSQLIQQWR